MSKTILIVDVGTDFIEDAILGWKQKGFICTLLHTMKEALKNLHLNDHFLIMLTMRHENRDEIMTLLPIMRDMTDAPIMVLSTEYDQHTRVSVLDSGADEFTLIPCTVEEGIATGLAQIRRYTAFNRKDSQPVTLFFEQSFVLSVEGRKVFIKGKVVKLSYYEFEILKLLAENQGRPLSYDMIFRKVWGEEYVNSSKGLLWTHINRLRQKLRVSPELPEYIKTVRNYGYEFDSFL